METLTETLITSRVPLELETAPAVTTCDACGAAVSPAGECLEIGTCRAADRAASHASTAGATSKYAVPAAWNSAGRVD